MLWICRGCTAAYAVGAASCPNCGSTHYEEDHSMPKITLHGGPSNEHDPEAADVLAAEPPEEESSPGTSSETSSSKGSSSPKQSGSAARSRARTTENPS